MAKLKLELPPGFIVIDVDKIEPDQMDEISDMLGEVKFQNSVYHEFPMLDGESDEEWQERITPLWLESKSKKKDESIEEYLRRSFKTSNAKKKILFDTLKGLAGVFGQADKVTEKAFGQSSYVMCKRFVIDVLKAIDFPTSDFE